MKDYFMDDPVYSEPNNSAVQLTLKNNIVARKERETGRVSKIITPELFSSLDSNEGKIVRHLYNSGPLTPSKTAELIGRSLVPTRKILTKLIDKDIIEVHQSHPKDPHKFHTLKEIH